MGYNTHEKIIPPDTKETDRRDIVMSVMPRDLACSYICPSTSLDTALVHSTVKSQIVRNYTLQGNHEHPPTVENGKFGPMIKYSCHRHLFTRSYRLRTTSLKQLDSRTRCFSPPLNTSLHSFRVSQPPSLAGKYAKCTASRISISSSVVRPDCTNCGYACG
jgi:hypothetical protein